MTETDGAAIGKVVSVNVGAVTEVDYKGKMRSTGIFKHPVQGPVAVRGVNLEGDDQADRKVHGGPRKAVYAYSHDDYSWWEDKLGRAVAPGAFGENLTVEGVGFAKARIGDRWRIGSALLEVTQPRVPCWKLAAKMKDPTFPGQFLKAARTGAYLSIVGEGSLAAGDEVRLVQRPAHPVTIGLVARLNHSDQKLAGLLLQLAGRELDPQAWEGLLESALESIGEAATHAPSEATETSA